MTSRRSILWLLVTALAGCVAAAAAGAGGGGTYYFTSRGVGSEIRGSVDDVAARARRVLEAEGIAIVETRSEASGDKRVFKGTKAELDVSVEVERRGDGACRAEISARKNLVQWDKAYAQRLLDLLVKS